MAEGRIVQIIGTVVDLEFPPDALPDIYNAVTVPREDGTELIVEVEQHLGNNWVRCLAMGTTDGLRRGDKAVDSGESITVPVGRETLGRMFNVLGEVIDNRGPVEVTERWPIHRPAPTMEEQSSKTEMLETGVKVIDLITPFTKGGKNGCFGGAGDGGFSVFAGVGERSREGNDLWHEMQESGVIDKMAMVFGQMNEPPGVRLRVALSGLTITEYFREREHQDVLLFIDNIYRYTLAGMEVSALLGRMPSAVGYQPTLATEVGELEERITSTKKGSITSFQAVYVPADDYTDPGVVTTFGHPH